MGCSPWGRKESDTTELLHFHLLLSCIGEGNGNTLQCSCLENPRDGEAWWAAVYGVAQSWTRLKRLSSSSSLRAGEGGPHSYSSRAWAEVRNLKRQGSFSNARKFSSCKQQTPVLLWGWWGCGGWGLRGWRGEVRRAGSKLTPK